MVSICFNCQYVNYKIVVKVSPCKTGPVFFDCQQQSCWVLQKPRGILPCVLVLMCVLFWSLLRMEYCSSLCTFGSIYFCCVFIFVFCWSLAHQCARSFWHAYDLWEGWLIQALIGCRLALIIFWAATEPNVITGNPTNLKFREPCPYGQVSCQVTCSLSMIDSNISPKDIRVCHCLPSCWPFTVYTAHGCYNPRCMNQRMQ